MRTKRIHINQHKIRSNRKGDEDPQPVVTVKTYKSNDYGFVAEIQGKAKVVYSPEKPLSCGAEVWVETKAPVLLDGKLIK